MFTLKDKYILGYISAIWVYLLFRACHTISQYANYDIILLIIIMFGGWFVVFNHRMFTMTRSKLCKHYLELDLEYVPFVKEGVVDRVFVRTINSNDWYEIDYTLTIPRYCGVNVYNEFVSKNSTVSQLLKSMNNKADEGLCAKEYKMLKTEYNSIRWLMLFVICMFFLFYFLISTNQY